MVWVKSKYAGEFAVVSAWIAAVLPWYVSYAPDVEGGGSVLYVRFSAVQIRYIFGIPFADAVTVSHAVKAKTLDSGAIETAYVVWWVGLAVLVLAVALSVFMYVDLETVEDALPVSSVRVMGGLLTLAGAVLAVATALFYTRTIFGEYPIPIGLAVMLLLGVLLLRVDLVGGDSAVESEPNVGSEAASPDRK